MIDKPWVKVTCEEWKREIPRRARRWAAEDAAVEEARVAAIVADREQREAVWTVDRIRALMTETRDHLSNPTPRG